MIALLIALACAQEEPDPDMHELAAEVEDLAAEIRELARIVAADTAEEPVEQGPVEEPPPKDTGIEKAGPDIEPES